VLIGDSISMGFGIAQRELTYPMRVEAALNASRRPTEVINLSVSGYQSQQEVATLHDKGLVYQPDLVLLQFCLNDFHDDWPANLTFTQKLLQEERAGGVLAASHLPLFLRHSALMRFVRFRVLPRWKSKWARPEPLDHLTSDLVAPSFAWL